MRGVRWTAWLALMLCAPACGSAAVHSSGGGVQGGSPGAQGAGAAAPSAGAGTRGRAPCGPAKARTLAQSHTARVYVSRGVVLGCASRSHTALRLGKTGSCLQSDVIGPVALAGVTAAYGSERCGVDTGSTLVMVRRLSDGKQLSATAAVSAPGPQSHTTARSLVVRSDGGVAWIAVASSIVGGASRTEVRRVDARGERLLDAGPGIAPGSLRLRRGVVRWRHGGTVRSATLV